MKKNLALLTFILLASSTSALVSIERDRISEGNFLGGTACSESLPAKEYMCNKGISISNLRPRLFVRADEASVGRGITLSELRSRMQDPEFADWIMFNEELRGRGNMPNLAMQFLLTGDRKYAVAAGEFLADSPITFGEHTSTAAAVYHTAIAFDWIREALDSETARIISDELVKGAEHLKGGVIRPAINHNYSIVSLYGLAMAAIAIYGEDEEKTRKSFEYLEIIENFLTGDQMLFETFKQKGGTWGEGNHYTPYVVYFPFLMTMRGITTASDIDYFSVIRNHYGNFIEPMSKFLIANFRPDYTMERIGDITTRVVPAGTFMRPLIELMASEAGNTELQAQVRSFSRKLEDHFTSPLLHHSFGWMMMVNYDPELPSEPSYKTLPLVMRFGEGTYEHIMFRNSWEEDGTLITYISGDQYTHHQHLDKGHFLIYKNGALAIDAGGYGRPMYGDNWANYSTRTIAHNSLLIYDPEEKPLPGTTGTIIYPDGGQLVQSGNQSHRSWQAFLEARESAGLNTAEVLAFEYDRDSNLYNYVKSDLTKAYGSRAASVERQMVYLPGADYLVIHDMVISGKPFNKHWLIHFEQIPEINGEKPGTGITHYDGNNIVRSQRNDTLVMGGRSRVNSGGLFIKSLLPDNRKTIIVGGPGYEYYNTFSNKNFPNTEPFDPVVEPGKWRMETITAQPETNTIFLHALQITDSNKKEMVTVKYLAAENGKMAGALFLSEDTHYVVLFNNEKKDRAANTMERSLDYSLNTVSPAFHIITDQEPGKKKKVVINGHAIGTFTTTEAGVLLFKDRGTGTRIIKITSG